jgi:hypothetical protein
MQITRNPSNLAKKAPLRRIIRNMLTKAAIPAAVGVAVLSVAPQAQASSNSYIYTQHGRPVAIALCEFGCGSFGRPIFPPNGTVAHMVCWVDGGNYDGNYTSNRYFYIDINGEPGEWFIHSSYVYYQTKVGHC